MFFMAGLRFCGEVIRGAFPQGDLRAIPDRFANLLRG
jgi:hypothetical protein